MAAWSLYLHGVGNASAVALGFGGVEQPASHTAAHSAKRRREGVFMRETSKP